MRAVSLRMSRSLRRSLRIEAALSLILSPLRRRGDEAAADVAARAKMRRTRYAIERATGSKIELQAVFCACKINDALRWFRLD